MRVWWLAMSLAGLGTTMASAAERRCGWLENPTPANWWLVDRAGEWTLSEQGGYVADGYDGLPDLGRPRGSWVETNGSYGYGCACITGTWNKRTMQATRMISWARLPLAKCKADKQLRRM